MPRIKIPESVGELFIIVDGGETFEGTLKQWENCFFSNPTVAGIRDFCKKNGCTVRFSRVNHAQVSGLPG